MYDLIATIKVFALMAVLFGFGVVVGLVAR